MKIIAFTFYILVIFALLSGCSNRNEKIEENGDLAVTEAVQEIPKQQANTVENITDQPYKLFMTSPSYWVGDIMPMIDDKGIHLYYLFDTDNNGIGYHPIHKFSTTNLYEYSDDGLVIPYATSTSEPDLAIGTGSFMLSEGIYHSFYTGHNDTYPKSGLDKECVMHAVSEDNINWTKIPEDTFQAPEGYSGDDFRDPFVFWSEEEGCYWMLISARTEEAGGFIARYTSEDLSKWVLQEPFYAPNKYYMMECPDLFKLGDYYYLFYSWNNVTYYAMSDSLYGPFYEPDHNVLDGQAFYAAKTTEYQGNRYLFGFINRKTGQLDTNNYSWAGNLCVYELTQNTNGTLRAKMPSQYRDYFKKNINLPDGTVIGNASINDSTVVVESEKGSVAGINFGTLPSTMMLTCKVNFSTEGLGAGFSFGNTGKFEKSFGIQLDIKNDLLRYDKCILERMRYADPITYTAFDFDTNVTYDLKLVVENEIIVLYMNETKVLSNRIYRARNNEWGIFGIGGKTVFSDIQIFTP